MARATPVADASPSPAQAVREARRRLLEATLDVIGTEGILAVTNRGVVTRTGVLPGVADLPLRLPGPAAAGVAHPPGRPRGRAHRGHHPRCVAAYDELAATALRALGIDAADARAHLVVAMLNGLALRRLAPRAPDAAGVAEALAVLVRALAAD